MANKFIEVIKKKWLRNITLTILLFAIIICAYLGINYAVSLANISDLDFTAEKILWLSTSPKLEKETISVLEVEKLFSEAFSFLFQKRNRNPTVKQERICVIKSNNPTK